MKYNNTSFKEGACEGMPFSRFKTLFAEKLKGHDLEEVFTSLGGKITKKPKNKEDVRGD